MLAPSDPLGPSAPLVETTAAETRRCNPTPLRALIAIWIRNLAFAIVALLPGLIVCAGLLVEPDPPSQVERVGSILILLFALVFAVLSLYNLMESFITSELAQNQLLDHEREDDVRATITCLRGLLVLSTLLYLGTLLSLLFATSQVWGTLLSVWLVYASTSTTYADVMAHNADLILRWRLHIVDVILDKSQESPEAFYYHQHPKRLNLPPPSTPIAINA